MDEVTPQEAPDWLRERISRLLSTFGLEGWRYDVHTLPQEALDKKAGAPGTQAYVHVNDCYLNGDFYFLEGIEDTEHGREHMVHEVLHCVFKPLNQAGFYLQQFIPKGRASEAAEAILVDGMEETVTRLSRAAAPLIDWNAE
jgi:hypothetical protein